jgi:hypothetical protein
LNAGAKVPQDHNGEYDRRQAHNLKVIGSNPIPETKQKAIENKMFSRAFAVWISARNFVRGSGRRKVAA